MWLFGFKDLVEASIRLENITGILSDDLAIH
jgi:hypothetical protein